MLLDKQSIQYTEYKYVTIYTIRRTYKNTSMVQKNIKLNKTKKIPQLVSDGTWIGGYSTVKNWLKPYYDFQDLYKTTKLIIRNLNKVIDINFYPTQKTEHSNRLHRPIGLGVQGLADVYCQMKYPFESEDAHYLNRLIFETIYYAAVETSCELAHERSEQLRPLISLIKKETKTTDDAKQIAELMKKYHVIPQELNRSSHFGSYSSFVGSPMSEGKFQFNLWGKSCIKKASNNKNDFVSDWDWDKLREKVMKYGTRNSLLVALMPTASTSQILGNNECFEPFTNNVYTRKTLAGLFRVVNKYLIEDLKDEGLWNDKMKSLLILHKGSVQNIPGIPQHIKNLYKTAYEVKQKAIIQQAIDRGPFIDQSQSMNLFVDNSKNISKVLDSALTMGWKNGLKTGLYYLRSKAAVDAVQFSIDRSQFQNKVIKEEDEECLMCGS